MGHVGVGLAQQLVLTVSRKSQAFQHRQATQDEGVVRWHPARAHHYNVNKLTDTAKGKESQRGKGLTETAKGKENQRGIGLATQQKGGRIRGEKG